MRSTMRDGRRRAGSTALEHPRHVVLAAALVGLLAGRLPGAAVTAAIVVSLAALAVPLARSAVVAGALGAVVLLAAVGAGERTAALERTALGPLMGHSITEPATVLSAARPDAFGGWRVVARLRDEPVLLRVARWTTAAMPPIGAVVRVRGRLAPADGTARAARAHAVLRIDELRDTGRRRGGLAGAVDAVRTRAERALGRGLPASEGALLRGMVLGQDAAMSDDLREAFRAAGLSHLIAASGQNVLLLAALAMAVTVVLGLGIRVRWALVLALIMMYVPLAGAGPSIQRAGIMGAATLVAALAGRPASRWYAILLAATITLAIDPRSAGDAGWQLSFGAVLGIVVLAPAIETRLRALGVPRLAGGAVAVTAAATLVTAPIIAWRFGQTSLVSLPANVLAAPAVAPIMWLGMSAAAVGQVAPGAAEPLVTLAALPLAYLVWLGRTAAALPGAQVTAAPLIVLAAAAGAALLARWRGRREPAATRPSRGVLVRRWVVAGVVALAVGALGVRSWRMGRLAPPAAGVLRITALDVGQGDATLLQAGGHAVLVDAGPAHAGVVAGLRRAGVGRLDVLVITHAQADHEGGAPEVLTAVPVTSLLDGRAADTAPASRALDAPLRRRGTQVVAAQAGQVVRTGPLALRVLWPPAAPAPPGTDPNDRAIVLVAGAYGSRALLTADAESPVLAPLRPGRADVLKVSHHGSVDEGLGALLEEVRPRAALVEVGRDNTYGHPAASTMRALAASVPIVRRTDRDGTVRIDLRAGQATVSSAGSVSAAGVRD